MIQGMIDGIKDIFLSPIEDIRQLFVKMAIGIGGIFYMIMRMFFVFIDIIQISFRKLAGLDSVRMNMGHSGTADVEGDIAIALIQHPTVQRIFFTLLILSVIILIIATFVSIIKNELSVGNDKRMTVGRILITKTFKAIIIAAVVPVTVIFALLMSSGILSSIDQASNPSGRTSNISGSVFITVAYDSSRINPMSTSYDEHFTQKIIDANDHLNVADINSFAEYVDSTIASGGRLENIKLPTLSQMTSGADTDDTRFYTVLYDMRSDYINRQNSSVKPTVSVHSIDAVGYFYDTSINSIVFFLIGILVTGIIAVMLIKTFLGLIERLYYLVMLFVILPPVAAITPVNPKAYGTWSGLFAKQALRSYGIILSINLFLMMIPILNTIVFFTEADQIPGISLNMMNGLIRILLIIAGIAILDGFTDKLESIVGSESNKGPSAAPIKNVAKSVKGAPKAVTSAAGKAAAIGTGGVAAAVMTGKAAINAPKAVAQGGMAGIAGGIGKAMGKEKGKSTREFANRNFASAKKSASAAARPLAPIGKNFSKSFNKAEGKEGIKSLKKSFTREKSLEDKSFKEIGLDGIKSKSKELKQTKGNLKGLKSKQIKDRKKLNRGKIDDNQKAEIKKRMGTRQAKIMRGHKSLKKQESPAEKNIREKYENRNSNNADKKYLDNMFEKLEKVHEQSNGKSESTINKLEDTIKQNADTGKDNKENEEMLAAFKLMEDNLSKQIKIKKTK